MILFIKHIDIEGPGTLGNYLDQQGYELKVIDLSNGDIFPSDLDYIEAVVSLGGPMNVYEETKYPFLQHENEFIQKVIQNNTPFLGICLGSQLLAKAAGSTVTKSTQKEIGFFDVELSNNSSEDLLFKNLSKCINVFQWHEDMSLVSERIQPLAFSNNQTILQAFKVGDCAYGLQFHVEITEDDIEDWANRYFLQSDVPNVKLKEDMIAEYRHQKENFNKTAISIYQNFCRILALQKSNA